MVRIVVIGALGRMGQRIIELARSDNEIKVAGMIEKTGDASRGILEKIKDVTEPYDCIIDFTTPEATISNLVDARKTGKPMVIGATGLSEDTIRYIQEASTEIPILFSPNMACGVNIFFDLIKEAAAALGKEYRVSIKEVHHIHKKDKPSGTAKSMAGIVEKQRGVRDLQVESLRIGETIGDHEIVFESDVDTIRISHSAKTRDIFALGALRAAKYISGKDNGLYSMADVLGL